MQWKNNIPAENFEEFLTRKVPQLELEKFSERVRNIQELVTELIIIESKLNDAYSVGKQFTHKNEFTSISELKTKINAYYSPRSYGELLAVIKPVLNRVEEIENIETLNEIALLEKIATKKGQRLALKFAAWTRLQQMDWPRNKPEVKRMRNIYSNLRSAINFLENDTYAMEMIQTLETAKNKFEMHYLKTEFYSVKNDIDSALSDFNPINPKEKGQKRLFIEKLNRRNTKLDMKRLQSLDFSAKELESKLETLSSLMTEILSFLELNRVLNKFFSIEKLLDAGFPIDREVNGISIQSLENQLKQKDFEFGKNEKRIRAIKERLSQLQILSQQDVLLAVRKIRLDRKSNPEIISYLWWATRKLKDWPQNLNEFKYEYKLRQSIKELIDHTIKNDLKWAKELKNSLRKEGLKIWLNFVNKEISQEDLDFAYSLLFRFNKNTSDLAPNHRFNFLLNFLKRKFDLTDINEENVKNKCQEILKNIQENYHDLQENEKRKEFVNKLNLIIEEPFLKGKTNFEAIGPAASIFAKLISPTIYDNGRKIVFTWKGRNSKKLVFHRIDHPNKEDNPFFLSQTEVPVWLLQKVIDASENRDFIEDALPSKEDLFFYTGPWTWTVENDLIISERTQWINTPKFMNHHDYYPEGRLPDPPTSDHPVNQISPLAALYFASLLNCRLPSSMEWRLAEETNLGTRHNLRDSSLEKLQRHLASTPYKGSHKSLPDFIFPNSEIFLPSEFRRERRVGKKAEFKKKSDGTIWFDPVESQNDQTFDHLIGNVAEYVFNDTHVFESEFGSGEKPDLQKVITFINNHSPNNLFVIGGSALSPPQLDTHKPYPAKIELKRGYSDVGFRLAYSVYSSSPSKRLAELIKSQPYLVKSK